MLIRKLVIAATLAAAGAAAHAGTVSTAAGGKDVGNLTDGVFGTKLYTAFAVTGTPPLVDAASPNGAIVITPPAAGNIGGGASVDLPPAADLAPGLIGPADHTPTHVPEPASLALMLAGVMGVGALRRRKQTR
jgi:PEP-CTERM motif